MSAKKKMVYAFLLSFLHRSFSIWATTSSNPCHKLQSSYIIFKLRITLIDSVSANNSEIDKTDNAN